VVEIPLNRPSEIGPSGEQTTELLLQLDEDLDADEAYRRWDEGCLETPTRVQSFEFQDRELVIGRTAAAVRGWTTDWAAWAKLQQLQAARREAGVRTTLFLLSDGSVKGKGFDASSTYGWVSYAVSDHERDDGLLPGCSNCTHVLAGGGKVAGPPEWTSSTRAEAVGLLAALMGAITAGWEGDIVLRLDNDSSVGRAGGLEMETEHTSHCADGVLAEAVLRDALKVENSDVWTEFVAWRDEHRRTGATVEVLWHPGHPEKRKRADMSDWNGADHAIFLADAIAETMHNLPTAPREVTAWSHSPAWTLSWRGRQLTGCVAQRLHETVRTDLLIRYLQNTGLGQGADIDWAIPELLARTIARKEGSLVQRVHRAKVVASILGTRYTQHRRGGLELDEDPMCRLCGTSLETDNHVLWECQHPKTTAARTTLAKGVSKAWREAGLGQKELVVAKLLWTLEADGSLLCKSKGDIGDKLGTEAVAEAAALASAMIGHTLDTTGLATERGGIFGKGWIQLLELMGLGRAEALNALVAVAEVLHGSKGTLAVWTAFTEALEDATTSHLDNGSAGTDFERWALEIRGQLRALQTEDDEPFRVLCRMAARGMTNEDRDEFQWLVLGWLTQVELDEPDRFEWAADLPDAVLMAMAQVTASRRKRGQSLIRAIDIRRAETKLDMMARRRGTRQLGTGDSATPKRIKRSTEKPSPMGHKQAIKRKPQASKVQRSKRNCKAAKAPQAQVLETKAQPELQDKATGTDDAHSGRGAKATEGSCKRKAVRGDTDGKRCCVRQKGQKRQLEELAPTEDSDRTKRAKQRNKRDREHEEEEAEDRQHKKQNCSKGSNRDKRKGTEQTHEAKRHQNTRERCSIGTSLQEPD
jgi:hypothetical protein